MCQLFSKDDMVAQQLPGRETSLDVYDEFEVSCPNNDRVYGCGRSVSLVYPFAYECSRPQHVPLFSIAIVCTHRIVLLMSAYFYYFLG